jgi:hypothetical protein
MVALCMFGLSSDVSVVPIQIAPKRTFAERIDHGIAQTSARRTARLESIVHRLGMRWVADRLRVWRDV